MTRELKVGDFFKLTDKHKVYGEVPNHFLYQNRKGDFSLAEGLVDLSNPHFSYFLGYYVVLETCKKGGNADPRDPYPDGHCVTAINLLDPTLRISFFQSGCFTATILPSEVELIDADKVKSAIDKIK